MSNFVHKVKDAIDSRDKPVTRSQAVDDRHHNTGNPFTQISNTTSQNAPGTTNPAKMDTNMNRPENNDTSSGNFPDTKTHSNQYGNFPTSSTTTGSTSAPNSSSMPESGSTTSSAGSADLNAGPHKSKMLNKMDPRVDSDLDSSASQPSVGPQGSNVGTQGMNPNSVRQQQPYNQGLDSHTSSEDSYSKSTQEHRSHRQPGQSQLSSGQPGGEIEEVDFNSSTQESKSHKTSSHMTPCTTDVAGVGSMPQSNTTQPQFGGDAAGGSSYSQNMGAGRPQGQHDTPLQKMNADANLPPEQQNVAGGQRAGGY